jgi:hypothetical protein
MSGYTKGQAYELGYALAHRIEELCAAASPRDSVAVLRATSSMRLAVEATITGGDAAGYELGNSFARGSVEGYHAATAAIAARVEGAPVEA